MVQRRSLAWLLVALMLMVPSTDRAEDAEAVDEAVDAELLEFLGSIDADDEDWIEFLSQTDVKQVAKTEPPSSESEAKK